MRIQREKGWMEKKLDEEWEKVKTEGRECMPMDSSEMARRIGCTSTYINTIVKNAIEKLKASREMRYLYLVYILDYEFDNSDIRQGEALQ